MKSRNLFSRRKDLFAGLGGVSFPLQIPLQKALGSGVVTLDFGAQRVFSVE